MHMYITASAAVILILTTGCTQSSPTANIEKERSALMSINRDVSAALKSADLTKFASYFAPDASVYAPGMKVIKGQPAIQELMGGTHSAQPGDLFEISANSTQVGMAGDVAYTTGTYQLSHASGPADNGKYVMIWKKQGDGSWRIVEDIFNSDAPAAPAH